MGLIYNWKDNLEQVKKTGIPASQLAKALGVSKWGTRLDLWLDRKGLLEDDFTETINMKWGKKIEDDIVERYQELHPEYVVERYEGGLVSDEYSKIHGYPDALIYENGVLVGILECKTGSHYMAKFWEGEVPVDYEAQGLGYLILFKDAQFVDFAFFYSTGADIIERRIERNEKLLEEISERAKEFWELVEGDQMPAEQPEDKSLIAEMHTPGQEYGELDVTGEALANEYFNIKKKIEALEEEKKAIEIELMNLVGDNAGLKNERYSVKWRITRRIDEKKVAEKYPEWYNASMQTKFSASLLKKCCVDAYNDPEVKKESKSIDVKEIKED